MTSYKQYKRQMAIMDADDTDIESWITVRGNHIPIKKGQSKEEAVKSFIESKNDKELSGRSNKPQTVGEATKKVVSQTKENKAIREESKKSESKYDPEFEIVRKNALANSNVYGGRYTQKSKAEAYKEYKNDTASKENTKRDVKNTFLSNPNTLKEFANHFGMSEKVVKNASEKFGDAFYHLMIKDPQAGVGLATNYEKYTKEDVEKHLEDLDKTKNKPDVKTSGSGSAPKEEKQAKRMLGTWGKYYGELYRGEIEHNADLVKEFDDKMKKDPKFKEQVQAFVRERGDVLSSDREVEAYMLALKSDKNRNKKPDNKVYVDKKNPNVKYVDPKAWNSPANDPWHALYDSADTKKRWSADWKKKKK